jgi:hypothetical protein
MDAPDVDIEATLRLLRQSWNKGIDSMAAFPILTPDSNLDDA